MRKFFVFLLMSLATLCIAATTPVFVDVIDTPAVESSLASKTLLNGITLAGRRIVCVGWRGHIIYSDDQGVKWFQASVPTSSDLVAVNFSSEQKGWAVGHNGIVLSSSNGGVTWQKIMDGNTAANVMLKYYTEHPPKVLPAGYESSDKFIEEMKRFVKDGADKPFLDVFFENESTGYIVGAFNLIFKTSDGGKNWEPWYDRTENPGKLHFYAIRSIGRDLFIVGEQGMIQKYDRASERFRAVKSPYQGSYFGLAGTPDSLVIFGLRGNLFLSKDGGLRWKKIESGISVGLTGGTVAKDGETIVVSQTGHILLSHDKGLNFKVINKEINFPATAVLSLDGDKVAITGIAGVEIEKIK